MTANLLALCHKDNGFIVKRVKVSADVQALLEGIFTQQEVDFFEGISEHVPFDGGWQPNANELLYVAPSPEITSVFNAAQANVVSLPQIAPGNFGNEGIRALGVYMRRATGDRLLVQNFSPRQSLERRFSLILEGDTFNRLTQPAFSLGVSLAGVVEANRLVFSKYSNIRMIFDLRHLYEEATSVQIDTFVQHTSFHVSDHEAFKKDSDQNVRKLVHAISAQRILDKYTVDNIVTLAANEGLVISSIGGKIVMPNHKSDVKKLLHFLDDAYYKAPLSGDAYITNSKKRVQ